jgi:hypothetical protein
MEGHWYQIGKHATYPIKHNYKYKNKNMPYPQVQHSDLISFQNPFQSNSKSLLQHSQNC